MDGMRGWYFLGWVIVIVGNRQEGWIMWNMVFFRNELQWMEGDGKSECCEGMVLFRNEIQCMGGYNKDGWFVVWYFLRMNYSVWGEIGKMGGVV